MIFSLRGKITLQTESYVIVEVNGVGYQVFVLPNFEIDPETEEINLYTHLYVREDILKLYGFLTLEELKLFELLITISGIGPKAAQGILSLANPKNIKMAIAQGDVSILTRVSGIGRKTAERVILELKNKVEIGADELEGGGQAASDNIDAIEALIGLGYRPAEAQAALKEIPSEIESVEEKIRWVLKKIGKK